MLDDSDLILQAYRSQRARGADEWTACEAALTAFRERHPEASAEFANMFVADRLRELELTPSEW